MRWPAVVVVLFLGCPTPVVPPTEGAPCLGEDIGRCDVTAPRLLQCSRPADGGALFFKVYADCKGERGCSVSADTADCDTSGNSRGDRCPPTSEGKVRCDPDGGVHILRCIDGGLESIYACPAPSTCGFDDAGLTCI